MTSKFQMLLATTVLAVAGAGCSPDVPFALNCKITNAVEAQDSLFVFDPAAGMAFRQLPQGWERGVPVEITDDRIVGHILPAPGQVGIRYDFDRKSGSGEQFVGNSQVGVGLGWSLEDCTDAPVPEGYAQNSAEATD